jgi:hypothetical protein
MTQYMCANLEELMDAIHDMSMDRDNPDISCYGRALKVLVSPLETWGLSELERGTDNTLILTTIVKAACQLIALGVFAAALPGKQTAVMLKCSRLAAHCLTDHISAATRCDQDGGVAPSKITKELFAMLADMEAKTGEAK